MVKNIIIIIAILLMSVSNVSADNYMSGFQRFTKEHPLRVLCDWNYPPYEYVDDNGEPAGYNVEVIERILSLLDIPHTFIMQETSTYMKMYARNDFDLAVDAKQPSYIHGRYYGDIPLGFYTVCAIHRDKNEISSISQLKGKKIYVQHGDISEYFLERDTDSLKMKETNDIHLAMRAVSIGDADCMVWVKEPSKWFLHKYGLKGLSISELNMPMQGFVFVSKYSSILKTMDEQLAHMQQNGETDYLHAKWFQHQTSKKDNSYIVLIGLFFLIVCTFLLLIFNHFQRNKIKKVKKHAENLFRMRTMALKMAKSDLMIISPDDIDSGTDSWSIKRVHPDDASFIDKLRKVSSGELDSLESIIRYNASTFNHQQWRYFSTTAIAEKKKHGKISNIVMTWKDISEDIMERNKYKEMSEKYLALFDSAIIGLSFYDKDGFLINSNDQMCRIFKIPDINKEIGTFNLLESKIGTLLRDKDNDIIPLYATTHVINQKRDLDTFIELQIEPVKDYLGNVVYIIVSTKDVTYERHLHLSLRENTNKYIKAEDRMKRYASMLKNVLAMSKTRIWICDLDKHIVKYSKDMEIYDKLITFEEYIKTLAPKDKQDIMKMLSIDEKARPDTIQIIQHIEKSIFDKNIWLAINGVAIRNSQGIITEYRGMMHDVTELMQTQERLKEETLNAERSEKMKSVFLANMSHEIRTPLNSIVGFSDLLEGLEKTERNEFLRIINNNCDMLLRLINDILELSEMDSNTETLLPIDVDWAENFNDICTSLRQRVTNPNVEFIMENPYKTFKTTLDAGRLNQVITNFVTNAVKYTKEGHIKVGYRYQENGLYIYCEDTGAGIPEDKREKIFERFVKLNDFIQGTGLGLSICKAIANRYSGKIGVDSTVDKGSNFWIWIPCAYVEKK